MSVIAGETCGGASAAAGPMLAWASAERNQPAAISSFRRAAPEFSCRTSVQIGPAATRGNNIRVVAARLICHFQSDHRATSARSQRDLSRSRWDPVLLQPASVLPASAMPTLPADHVPSTE